jgi:hypothetical protein
MAEYQKQPQVKVADVREYVSANGKQYFSYYAGRAKYLLFKDEKAELTGNETGRWSLYVQEAPPFEKGSTPTGGGGQKPASQGRPTAPRGPRGTSPDARASRSLRSRGLDPAGALVEDDDLGF